MDKPEYITNLIDELKKIPAIKFKTNISNDVCEEIQVFIGDITEEEFLKNIDIYVNKIILKLLILVRDYHKKNTTPFERYSETKTETHIVNMYQDGENIIIKYVLEHKK